MNCTLYDQSNPVFTWLVEKEVSKKEVTLQGEKEKVRVRKGGKGKREPQCFGISPYPVIKYMSHELSSVHVAHEKKRYQRKQQRFRERKREKREKEWGGGGGGGTVLW